MTDPSIWLDADFTAAWGLLTEPFTLALLLGGAFAAAFVSGLTGFGSALVTLGFWLYVMPPQLAVPLVCLSGAVAHISGLRAAFEAVPADRLLALSAPGVIGLPIGIALLAVVDTATMKPIAGVIILGISLSLLALSLRRRFAPLPGAAGGAGAATVAGASATTSVNGGTASIPEGTPARGPLVVLGLIGGVLGGLAGLSGALPALYAQLMRWPKGMQRPLFQVFNMTVLGLAVVGAGISGILGPAFVLATALALPVILIGSEAGRFAFRYVDEGAFRLIVLVMLCVSGTRLLMSG